jgi:hypothetical protein
LALFAAAPAAYAAPGDPIVMPDAALRACANNELSQPPGDPITEAQAESITTLSCNGVTNPPKVTDLTGIETLANLEVLDVNQNDITDVSLLANLNSLTDVYLGFNDITDLSPLLGLGAIERLNVAYNTGLDGDDAVQQVSTLTTLTYLSIGYNGVTDVGPLANLASLEQLSLESGNVSDIGPLASLGSLTELNVQQNHLVNLTDVPSSVANSDLDAEDQTFDLGELAIGAAEDNPVVDASGNLVALDALYDSGANTFTPTTAGAGSVGWDDTVGFTGTLSFIASAEVVIPDPNLRECINDKLGQGATHAISVNQAASITEMDCSSVGGNGITELTGLDALTSLTELDLSDDGIDDVTVLGTMPSLTELNLEGNDISDFAPVGALTGLTDLSIGYNPSVDLSDLTPLTSLEGLGLKGLGITDVSDLAGLATLEELDLSENDITDVSPLAGLSALLYLDLDSNAITDISSLRDYDYDTFYLSVRSQNVSLGNLDQGVAQANPVVETDGQPVALGDDYNSSGLDELYDAGANTFTPTDLGSGLIYWGGSDDYFTGTLTFTLVEQADPNPSGEDNPADPADPAEDQVPADVVTELPTTPVLAETGVDVPVMGLGTAAAGLLLAGGLMVARTRRKVK